MDKEQEIRTLRDQLKSINIKIVGEIGRIETVKTSLSTTYRRADREKYEAERAEITSNLKKYRDEMDTVKRKIAELEATQ
jgi:uncharacterized coiled-coil DUF342 family protein